MEKEKIINEINSLIKENTNAILPTKWHPEGMFAAYSYVKGDLYKGWHTKTLTFLKLILSPDSDYITSFTECAENKFSNAQSANSILTSLVECIEKGYISIEQSSKLCWEEETTRLLTRFHRVVRQLRLRHDKRSTLDVIDEYDVQDLLHALLKIYFDDVRPEEWTPSYSGKSARMDFLLKNEKTVIEIKKTRLGLADKEISDQLIVDIERYQQHPDCQRMICFIYDPEGRIANPSGLSNDLMMQHKDFLTVIINPLE